MSSTPISVNIALTNKCNYRCRFCYGHLRGFKRHFIYDGVLRIPKLLNESGCEKLTIEGGEPFLSPYLAPLLYEAKKVGLATCVVTNGSYISREQLEVLSPYIDWIGISIDSQHDEVEEWLGRGGNGHTEMVKTVAKWCHEFGIRLKVNTVVTSVNYQENLTDLIIELGPDRWKAFQVLRIKGENDIDFDELEIIDDQFQEFVDLNSGIGESGIHFVPEFNHDMDGSYIMILPDGHFFNKIGESYVLGENSIFEIGVERGLEQVDWKEDRFLARGGVYDFTNKKKEVKIHG